VALIVDIPALVTYAGKMPAQAERPLKLSA